MKALLTALALTFGLLCASGSAKENKDDAPDPKKFEEYKANAVKGDAEAQRRLGVCYAEGTGVKKDEKEAFAWVNIAAVNDPKAAVMRDKLEANLTPGEVSAGKKRTKELREQIDAKLEGRKRD